MFSLSSLACGIAGFLYPAFRSFKAIRDDGCADGVQCAPHPSSPSVRLPHTAFLATGLTYWVTFALFRCVESLLDIEYAGSIAGAIPLEVYYSGTYSLLAWANKLGDAKPAPLVNSVSYGNDEAQQTGSAYMESVNAAFMKVSDAGGKRFKVASTRIFRARSFPRKDPRVESAPRDDRPSKNEPKRMENDRARSL